MYMSSSLTSMHMSVCFSNLIQFVKYEQLLHLKLGISVVFGGPPSPILFLLSSRAVFLLSCLSFELSFFWAVFLLSCHSFGLSFFWAILLLLCLYFGLFCSWYVFILGYFSFEFPFFHEQVSRFYLYSVNFNYCI